MISKAYAKQIAKGIKAYQDAYADEHDGTTRLYNYEHIDFGKYRVRRSECDAEVGSLVQAKFMGKMMKSKGKQITHLVSVFMKDNDFTYISIY